MAHGVSLVSLMVARPGPQACRRLTRPGRYRSLPPRPGHTSGHSRGRGLSPCLLSAIPSTWRSPTARAPVGSPRRHRRQPRHALPAGDRVVALREVVGMARAAILLICPPGEGVPMRLFVN